MVIRKPWAYQETRDYQLSVPNEMNVSISVEAAIHLRDRILFRCAPNFL